MNALKFMYMYKLTLEEGTRAISSWLSLEVFLGLATFQFQNQSSSMIILFIVLSLETLIQTFSFLSMSVYCRLLVFFLTFNLRSLSLSEKF